MKDPKKIHCPYCGVVIEFPSETEGRTDTCPSCKSPVWLSHLAEKNGTNPMVEKWQTTSPKINHASSSSNSTIIGLLVLLIVFNLVLGYQVVQIKGQINKKQDALPAAKITLSSDNQNSGANQVRESRVGLLELSNQETLNELLNALELLDEDITSEMAEFRNKFTAHSESISELMDAAGHLDTSIESIYEDLSNVSTRLDELSNSMTEVSENQIMLQNILNQSTR